MRTLSACLVSLPLILACRDDAVTAPLEITSAVSVSPAGASLLLRWPLRIDLGTLDGFERSFAADINRFGTVVGWADNVGGLSRAFRWRVWGGMTDLGTLPGDDWSTACCILDDGRILGVSGSSTVSADQGTTVIWSSDGAITALPIPLLPGATFGFPADFNERGDVVGWDACVGTCLGFVSQHAWFWSEALGKFDIMANFPGFGPEGVAVAVNRDGLALGTHDANAGCWRLLVLNCWRPFLWSHESGFRELGTPWEGDTTAVATASDLGDGPTVVGTARSITLAVAGRPFVWTQRHGFSLLPVPSPGGGSAFGLNNRGTVVGNAWNSSSTSQAVAWRRSGGAIRLSPGDPNPSIAVAVNDLDIVVGWSAESSGANHATLWLLGPASHVLVALADRDPHQPEAGSGPLMTAAAVASACLSDAQARMSRRALFACVARSAASR